MLVPAQLSECSGNCSTLKVCLVYVIWTDLNIIDVPLLTLTSCLASDFLALVYFLLSKLRLKLTRSKCFRGQLRLFQVKKSPAQAVATRTHRPHSPRPREPPGAHALLSRRWSVRGSSQSHFVVGRIRFHYQWQEHRKMNQWKIEVITPTECLLRVYPSFQKPSLLRESS